RAAAVEPLFTIGIEEYVLSPTARGKPVRAKSGSAGSAGLREGAPPPPQPQQPGPPVRVSEITRGLDELALRTFATAAANAKAQATEDGAAHAQPTARVAAPLFGAFTGTAFGSLFGRPEAQPQTRPAGAHAPPVRAGVDLAAAAEAAAEALRRHAAPVSGTAQPQQQQQRAEPGVTAEAGFHPGAASSGILSPRGRNGLRHRQRPRGSLAAAASRPASALEAGASARDRTMAEGLDSEERRAQPTTMDLDDDEPSVQTQAAPSLRHPPVAQAAGARAAWADLTKERGAHVPGNSFAQQQQQPPMQDITAASNNNNNYNNFSNLYNTTANGSSYSALHTEQQKQVEERAGAEECQRRGK
ncbi:hypothetical protein T492DRAFT_886054, partial [Pavlovales sp. CCMP2436]